MRAELRADGLHIDGYVNIPGRESRPVETPRGRVIEIIEPRAFDKALGRASDVAMLIDHDPTRKLASRSAGNLSLREDQIGLRAESVVTDEEVIQAAKEGKLKGWSFNIRNPKDTLEERADKLPIRRISDFDMDEITLVLHKIPVYSATSVEFRAGDDGAEVEHIVETRSFSEDFEFVENKKEPEKPKNKNADMDYNAIKSRIDALRID